MKNYKMKVTVTMTVYDIEAKNDLDAKSIVYDMFKDNEYGVVEWIDSDVLDEEDMGDDEEDEEE